MTVRAIIPTSFESQPAIWWDIARHGYGYSYHNGCVHLLGVDKDEDEVADFKEKCKKYGATIIWVGGDEDEQSVEKSPESGEETLPQG